MAACSCGMASEPSHHGHHLLCASWEVFYDELPPKKRALRASLLDKEARREIKSLRARADRLEAALG